MAKKKKKKRRRSGSTSPLSAHERSGRVVKAPLTTVPNLVLTSWAFDTLPDFLWLCAILTDDIDWGMRLICDALDLIDDVADDLGETVSVYGSLTQFESVPESVQAESLARMKDTGIYGHAFPEEFAHALGMYPDAPGQWIIEPRVQDGLSVDPEVAQRYLAPIIAESHHGQDAVPTRAKFLYLRGMVKDGRMHVPRGSEIPDLLSRYPNRMKDDDETAKAESVLRAAFSALMGASSIQDNDETTDAEGDTDESIDARAEWCKTFWRSNWHLYVCIPPDPYPAEVGDRGGIEKMIDVFETEVADLRARFDSIATTVDPDIYSPDRHEVLTGIAARALRLAEGAVTAPSLWTSEYGSGILRSVVEAKILLHWLHQKNDQSFYTAFKAYGRGRLKLLMLQTEEYVESLDDVPEPIEQYLEALRREVNADLWEEFQDIDLGPTFSGVSARQMAIDVGLKNDYDFLFAPASGEAHGDWTSLDRYALTRCRNPLHLWHRIPNPTDGLMVNPGVIESVVHVTAEVVDVYVDAIGEYRPR